MHPITHYFIGLDLGRDRDHSAIAVLALRTEDHGPFDHARWVQPTRPVLQLGALQRIPLGTEYLAVIRHIRTLIQKLKGHTLWPKAADIYLIVDAGGPGPIAVELLRKASLGVSLVPVLLTGGYDASRLPNGNTTVPRRQIITNLRFLLETKILLCGRRLRHIHDLEREMGAIRAEGGQAPHDDLGIAVGLAAWYATRQNPALLRQPRAA